MCWVVVICRDRKKGKWNEGGDIQDTTLNNWGIIEEWNGCRCAILPKTVGENLWKMTAEKEESERPRQPSCCGDVSSQGCRLVQMAHASLPDRHPVQQVSRLDAVLRGWLAPPVGLLLSGWLASPV